MEIKEKNIQKMFSSIASSYDFLNRLLSCGVDIYWRRMAKKKLMPEKGEVFLDVATGTCDLALEIVKNNKSNTIRVVGLDFSLSMLKIGMSKIRKCKKKIPLFYGDGQYLPFRNNSFNGSIIAFGLRNISNRKLGVSEMTRVVKKGGKVIILEFTTPENYLFKKLYYFYFQKILPLIGGFISGESKAYKYLPESVVEFPTKEKIKILMEETGLINVEYTVLSFGIAAIYLGIKN